MYGIWIWAAAVLLYGGFSLWYNGWRAPLTHDEVEHYMERLLATPEAVPDSARAAAARAFLESDDGKEFFMVNLIRLHPEPVELPGSSERKPAAEVLGRYTGYVMSELAKRAGHPAFAAPAVGGNIEEWGIEAGPGWTFSGVIRYRSRRDMIELATDPRFTPAHAFKVAAIANTFAFPSAPAMIPLGPRLVVGLGLALFAALIHLSILLLRGAAA
ncbi:MAG: hypothetical protein ACE5FL_03490 [Myxococcota bacterium]